MRPTPGLGQPNYALFKKINFDNTLPVTMYYHSERQLSTSFLSRLEQKTQSVSVRLSFLSLAVMSVFFYVFQVNQVAASSFTIGQLEKQISKLQTDNRQIDVQVAEVQSIARLTTQLQTLGYVPIDHLEYASLGGAVVAKR